MCHNRAVLPPAGSIGWVGALAWCVVITGGFLQSIVFVSEYLILEIHFIKTHNFSQLDLTSIGNMMADYVETRHPFIQSLLGKIELWSSGIEFNWSE